ncbi:serine hydrolase [Amycolatopsis rhizosphaerae]|uniref:Serine hydrolase n=1 Tax=Amycolatopsis rhizosphaerae TaxID=2053003 RepID=A0A558AGL8_9PSEU|nr:serine hydrolase [Amycolatopsis rhizosphaerae]TVT23412.1 serine hydrolase [Amycolatopsis rhizosphaerae]
MKLSALRRLVVCTLPALLALTGPTITSATAATGPTAATGKVCGDATANYETATPEQAGLDPEKLWHALNLMSVNGSETVQVFRNNCRVGSGIFDPLFDAVPSNNWSQTKTITALLVGRAVTLGRLSVDDPIDRYLPPGLGDAAHRAVTVRQLLTQTSGIHMNWGRELNLAMPDRIREFMALPFDHRPGTFFRYDQIGPSVVAYVVQRAVGEDLQDFAQRELFTPIGIGRSSWFWLRDRSGHTDGWSNLFLPGGQFGRIGQLLLNQGTFHGRRLISADYLRQLRTPTPTNPGYGFLTWLNAGPHWITPSAFAAADNPAPMIPSAPEDMYLSYGFFGQHIFVLPSVGMVVTRSSGSLLWPPSRTDVSDPLTAVLPGQPGRVEYEFFKLLMEAVRSPRQPQARPYVPPKPGAVDPTLIINPADNLALADLGPTAPKGCTILGCDGKLAVTGTVRSVMDIPRAGVAAVTALPAGLAQLATQVPDLLPRLLDGWEQTARITGRHLPEILPNLLGSLRQTLSSLQPGH